MARPVGRKKLVCATLSINCMTAAASSGGKASSSRKAVTNCAQTKNGRRIQVMPGARNWMIVAMKLTAPKQRRGDQEHHADDPEGLPVGRNGRRQRGVGGPARLGRAAGDEEAGEHDQPADHVGLVAGHVHAREGHVRRADLQRHDVIAERGKGQRHDGHEDHDRPVHRAEGVVQVRRHDALGRHVAEDRGQQRADHRHRLARVGDLPAHDHHQAEAEQQEAQAR